MVDTITSSAIPSPFHFNEFPANSEKMDEPYRFLMEHIVAVEFKQVIHPETKVYASTRIFYTDEALTFGFIAIGNQDTKGIDWYWLNREAHQKLQAGRAHAFRGDNS